MMRDEDRVPAWRRYVRFWRANPRADVREELDFHLKSAADELVARGVPADVAREAARRQFGDMDRITKTLNTLSEQRERRMTYAEWFDALRGDIVFGIRQLRKTPVFTAIAVLTLALGIGANTAIFSIVYSVLIRPLPFANVSRIVRLSQRNGQDEMWSVPSGNFMLWRQQAPGFQDIGGVWGGAKLTLTGEGEPLPVTTYGASASFWRVFSVPPARGHYYTDAEDRDGAAPVAVISYALWTTRFNRSDSVIGRPITLNGKSYQVVAVAPPGYDILTPPAEAIWTPLALTPQQLNEFSDHEMTVFGLVKDGAATTTAVKQVEQVDTRLARDHPHSYYDGGIIAKPFVDVILGDARARLYLLLGSVALVLLIACANVANLLLARATVRRTEIAVRSALGATRRRIVGQMLSESLLIGLAGGVLGVLVAAAGVRFLKTSPVSVPRLQEATLNAPVLLFTLALSIACAIVFGLVPALRAARTDLQQTLRDGGRESRGTSERGSRMALVVAELCVAQVLVIGAGLLIRSSFAIGAVPIGFDIHNLLITGITLPPSRYQGADAMEAAFQQIENAIAAIPGVKAVGRTQVAPIAGWGWDWPVKRQGSNGHDEGAVDSDMRYVSANYFAALGQPVLRGRAFTSADSRDAPKVVIVSRSLAKRLWGDADPVGKFVSNSFNGPDAWREVVGVVDDAHSDGIKNDVPKVLYMPTTQQPNSTFAFMIRGAVPVATLVPSIRRAVSAVDPSIALFSVRTMEAAYDQTLSLDRFTRWLFTLLGATGLIVAVIGVYGVIAYFVTQRWHELGVRIALGAPSGTVRWIVVRQGLVLGGVGLLLGVPLSLAATRLLRSSVFGITPHDPLTFVAVALGLVIVALAASYIPARRATRIDPLEALRST